MQKHDATRLHYDFRLEHDGVLKSWAVPKEPSLNPKDRRLAVQVEDHPLDYGGFEGEIPEGQYGAGSVVIWDRGHWQPLGDTDEGLKDGKLDFELDGRRLKGRFTLVRMAERGKRKPGKDNWLLLKRHDAKPPRAQDAPRRAPGRKRRALRRTRATSPARGAATLPAKPSPQLATPVTRPPEGAGLAVRAEARRLSRAVPHRGRRRHGADAPRQRLDRAVRQPSPAAARALPCRAALIDGEAVVYDSRGVTSFQRLQNALTGDGLRRSCSSRSICCISTAGICTRVPLVERKALLERLLEGAPPAIRYGEHVTEDGAKFFAAACKLGLEGIVAKRAADPYRAGTHAQLAQDQVPASGRSSSSSASPTPAARARRSARCSSRRATSASAPLRYAGKVGTGFDERTLEVAARTPAAARAPHAARRARVGARRWRAACTGSSRSSSPRSPTPSGPSDGRLRHPIFVGLREDKPAAEIVEERAERRRRTPAKPAADGARRQAPRAAHASRQGAVPRSRHHETAARRLLARRSPTSRCRCCATGR